jgi:hypothetical protein
MTAQLAQLLPALPTPALLDDGVDDSLLVGTAASPHSVVDGAATTAAAAQLLADGATFLNEAAAVDPDFFRG